MPLKKIWSSLIQSSRIDQLKISENKPLTVWLKGIDFPVSLVKQVFTNKDGSTGILYLVCNDLSLDYQEITTIYKKRWKVEVFHKSIKSQKVNQAKR